MRQKHIHIALLFLSQDIQQFRTLINAVMFPQVLSYFFCFIFLASATEIRITFL